MACKTCGRRRSAGITKVNNMPKTLDKVLPTVKEQKPKFERVVTRGITKRKLNISKNISFSGINKAR